MCVNSIEEEACPFDYIGGSDWCKGRDQNILVTFRFVAKEYQGILS